MSEQMMSLSTKVSGFPMYMEINAIQNGMDMTIKTEVTEVKNEKVSDEKFSLEIPEGYEDGSSLLGN
jgi:outer membrane lipoprotein-sorting protein